jgi:hypothetical protein
MLEYYSSTIETVDLGLIYFLSGRSLEILLFFKDVVLSRQLELLIA